MAIKRFIKKPSVPSLTGWPDWAHGVMSPIKQTLEIITGRRGEKLEQLSGPVELDAVAEKVNEVIRVLQDGQDVDVQGAALPPAQPQVTVNNITQTVIQQVGGETGGTTYWDPGQLDGVALWLDASDDTTITLTSGAVSAWADKSGANRNATQSTAAARPVVVQNVIGSKPAIRFDGTDDVLAFSEITTVAAVFMLMRWTDEGGDYRPRAATWAGAPWASMRWTDEGGDYRPLLGHSTASHFHGALAGSQFQAFRLLDPTSSLAAVRDAIRYSTGRPIVGDGTRVTDWQVVEFVLAGNATIGNLASDRGLSGRFLKGDVAELVVIDRSNTALFDGNSRLLDVHRTKIEGYLAWKWGLQTQLPDDHPHRYAGNEFGFFTNSILSPLPDLIVNGSMEVIQRPTSSTTSGNIQSNINGRAITADRFYAHTSDETRTLTLSHITFNTTDAPRVFGRPEKYAIRLKGNSFVAGYQAYVFHTIKAPRFLPWLARSFALRFAVNATATGLYGVTLMSGAPSSGSRMQCMQTYTVNTAGAWEEKVVTFPPLPRVYWANCADVSLVWTVRSNLTSDVLGWFLNTNVVPYGPTGQANPLNNSSGEWFLTGVSVVGSEPLSAAETAAECARFYRRSATSGQDPHDNSGIVYQGGHNSAATGDVRLHIDFGRAMAQPPRVTTYQPGQSTRGRLNRLADNTAITGLDRVTAQSDNKHSWLVSMAGQTDHGVSFCWEADAEPTP